MFVFILIFGLLAALLQCSWVHAVSVPMMLHPYSSGRTALRPSNHPWFAGKAVLAADVLLKLLCVLCMLCCHHDMTVHALHADYAIACTQIVLQSRPAQHAQKAQDCHDGRSPPCWTATLVSMQQLSSPLCCAALCCAVLCCAVLCCAVLRQVLRSNMAERRRDNPAPAVHAEQGVTVAQYAQVKACMKNFT